MHTPLGLATASAVYLGIQTAVERLLLFIIPVAIFQSTGRLSISGVAYFAEWLPVVMSLPLVGALVDRRSATSILRWTNIARSAVVAVGAASVWMSWSPAALIAVGALLGVANIFAYVAFERFASGLPQAELTRAYSYFQSLQYLMLLAMPILGSAALAGQKTAWLLAACAAIYLCYTVLPTGFAGPESSVDEPLSFRAMVETARALLTRGEARAFVVMMFAANLTYGALYSALPALTDGDQSGVLLPLGYGSAAVLSLIYAWASKTIDAREWTKPLGIVAGIVTTALPVVLLISGSALLASAVFTVAIGPMVAFTVWSRVVRNKLLDERNFALQTSVMMVGTTLAYPAAGLVLAVVGDQVAPHYAVGLLSVVCMVLLIGSLAALRRRGALK